MNATDFKKINFLNQTGNFDYDISLTVSNFTGFFEFGLSGSGQNLSFNGQYGKLRDKSDNLLLGYISNQPLQVHGNIYSGKESLSVDGYSIYKNIENTGYNFNYFYLNPVNCEVEYFFSLTGEATDFNLSLSNKKIKNFNITGADGTTFSTKTLTGLILNQNPNLEIKIFSGIVLNKSDYYSLEGFPTSFYNSGQYLINTHTGEDALVNDLFQARFYTNFGIVDKTIQISGEVIPLFFLYFNILPEISGFPNIQTGFDRIFVNNIKNYYVSYGYVSGAQVQASLTYLQGLTGNVTGFLNATGNFSGYLSGFLTGSGFLSTFISETGIKFSGFNDFLNSIQNVEESGFFAQKFDIATGYSQSNYYVSGFGLGSGIILKDIYGSGAQQVTYSGQIPYIGGLNVIFNPQSMIGTGRDVNEINEIIYPEGNLDYTNVTNSIKILYTGILTGLVLDTGAYSLKTFNFEPIRTGKFTFESFIPGTGLKSGISITGIVNPKFFIDMPFGYFEFTKKITGQVSGESRTQDETSIFTGIEDLFNCKPADKARKYLATAFSNSGIIVSGSAFLSTCYDGQIPSGFLVKFEKPGEEFYLILDKDDECEEPVIVLDAEVPKWIVIKPTGIYELLINSGISGTNAPLNTDDSFFSENPSKQYQLFSNFSGKFQNVISDQCKNSGIWEQYFETAVQLDERYSDFYIKKINVNLISLEDNGRDYPSEVYFKVNKNENYNFQLTQNNIVINSSPQRDLYLKLILSKKILDGYSGFFETGYFQSFNNVSFCTGLSTGEYRAKIKYLNFDRSPKIRSLCRIPVQIANILDKNIYNKPNIDLFTGSGLLSQRFYGFRYYGSGWHQQANVYYTKNSIYGHNFITGYTNTYRNMLYTPPFIDTAYNFTSDRQLIKALDFTLTGLAWSGSGIRNINLFTNRIALSGISRNNFLQYIKNINNSGRFTINVFDAPDFSTRGKQDVWYNTTYDNKVYSETSLENKLNVFSTDNFEPFLKDIAEIGGGTYYNLYGLTHLRDLYSLNSLSIAPIFTEPMYAVCDGAYPAGSFPTGDQPDVDTTPGQTGIDLVPIIIPVIPIPIPITGGDGATPPGPDIPPAAEENNPPDPESRPRIGGGGGGGGGGGSSTGGTTSKPGCLNPSKYSINQSVGGLEWTTQPEYGLVGGKCKCKKQGLARAKITFTNPNCAPNSTYGYTVTLKVYSRGSNIGTYRLEAPLTTVPAGDKGSPGTTTAYAVGKACGPVKGEYMTVAVQGYIKETQWGTHECTCECPDKKKPPREEKYNLEKNCPNSDQQEEIFYWECEAEFESPGEDFEEAKKAAIQYDKSLKRAPAGAGPWWIIGSCRKCGDVGCTWDAAPNYDEDAKVDDGSCKTCENEGLCRYGDDCKGSDCNSVGNGCCDEGCLPCDGTGDDCSPTRNNFKVTEKFGGGFVYYLPC